MNGGRQPLREVLKALYAAALAGVDPHWAVTSALARPPVARALASARRIGVFAVGKAAAPMLEAAPGFDAGLAVLPNGYAPPVGSRYEILFASHPLPDRSSVTAARAAVRFFQGFDRKDAILCLISGGTSSLLCLPRAGLTLAEKREAVRKRMAAGDSILELNRLRKRLSAVKGGRLGRATKARLVTLVLSDVAGDDPAVVGSGPTIRGRRSDLVLVVGTNRGGLLAAARAASGRGLLARIVRRRLAGEAVDAGDRFAKAVLRMPEGSVLLAGGETTVTLGRRTGRGGRALEFALAGAHAIGGERGVAILAAGSDGIDGSSKAAGAWIDGRTISRAQGTGLDLETALRRHDTEPFFARLGDLFVTGPTGTNVGDWAFAVRAVKR